MVETLVLDLLPKLLHVILMHVLFMEDMDHMWQVHVQFHVEEEL